MIKVKAWWMPLGHEKQGVSNGYFILDITCFCWKRSVIFHIHLKNINKRNNPIEIEHGFGEPNVSCYQQKEYEVREKY